MAIDPARLGLAVVMLSRRRPMRNLFAFWVGGMLAGIGVLIVSSQLHVMVDDRPRELELTTLQQALANNPRAEFWFNEEFAHGQLGPDYQSRVRKFFQKNLS